MSGTDWSRAGTLIADADGDLIGCVSYGPARDDDQDRERVGEIFAIHLLPAAWGTGTGRQLMSAALGRLAEAGFDQAILWLLDSNVRARRSTRRAAGLTMKRSGSTRDSAFP